MQLLLWELALLLKPKLKLCNYEIKLDVDNFAYSVASYVPADYMYMDPMIYEQGSESLNTWWAWEETGSDEWVGVEDAWWQEFYIGDDR